MSYVLYLNIPFNVISVSGIYERKIFSNGRILFLTTQRGLFLYSLEPGDPRPNTATPSGRIGNPEQRVTRLSTSTLYDALERLLQQGLIERVRKMASRAVEDPGKGTG